MVFLLTILTQYTSGDSGEWVHDQVVLVVAFPAVSDKACTHSLTQTLAPGPCPL